MELQQALEQLSRLQAKMAAYNHAMALIYYDGATTAPKGTAANRGQTLSILSEESYRLSTGKDTVELLEFLDAHREELSEREARTVFLALKSIRELQKIPMEEYVAYQQLLVEAEDVWHTAKETDDFALFCPFLERIFEFEKKLAAYCAPEKKPYDYCLDKYEDGLTMEDCDAFFEALRSRLVPLIQRITAKEQLSDEWSDEEKEAFLADAAARVQKSKWMLTVIIPLLFTFLIDSLQLFIFEPVFGI